MVNILAIVSDNVYGTKIYSILGGIISAENKILYVSLNKTYKSLTQELKENNIDLSKFFFVDTISATVIEPEPQPNCLFISSASNVRDLYSAIVKTVKKESIDALIFDSLSSLTTYKNTDEIENFVTNLLAALSLLGCSAVFTCLKSDEDTNLVKHMRMKVDKIHNF